MPARKIVVCPHCKKEIRYLEAQYKKKEKGVYECRPRLKRKGVGVDIEK